jgi:hypothetical protein
MKQIKKAIYDLLLSRTRLVALLGGASAISQGWPAIDAKYTPVPIGSTYDALQNVTPPRARLTITLIQPEKDLNLPSRDDLFQLDVWSPNQELVEEIVSELEKIDEIPLTATDARVTEMMCTRGPDLYEEDTRVYHTPMNLRVLWNP